jgi:ribosomal protein S18 acetylase RimI-like enzyme
MDDAVKRIRSNISSFLDRLHNIKFYRTWLSWFCQNLISYRIATASDAAALSRCYGYEGAEGVKEFTKFIESDRIYYPIATVKGKVVGAVKLQKCFHGNVVFFPDWWIFLLVVCKRYRGMGIGQKLLSMALREAAVNNATGVNLQVFEQSKAAINLYRKMGFQRISIPELEKLEQEVQKGKKGERILMSISLEKKATKK